MFFSFTPLLMMVLPRSSTCLLSSLAGDPSRSRGRCRSPGPGTRAGTCTAPSWRARSSSRPGQSSGHSHHHHPAPHPDRQIDRQIDTQIDTQIDGQIDKQQDISPAIQYHAKKYKKISNPKARCLIFRENLDYLTLSSREK